MAATWFMVVFISVLSGCAKPPELAAPCEQFGKFCPQYPINDEPIQGGK